MPSFRKQGLDLRVVDKLEYGTEISDWADVIFTAGGDGTFLMAASKVGGHSKPVIGINTDPLRSVSSLVVAEENNCTHSTRVLYTDDNQHFYLTWFQHVSGLRDICVSLRRDSVNFGCALNKILNGKFR